MSIKETEKYLIDKYGSLVLTKEQAAKELNISQTTLDRLRRRGAIASKLIGGQVMFKAEELARFLAA